LINSAVDAELGGHRVAPPIEDAAFADRPGAARTVRLWSAPLLAASVAVLLAVGAMLVITQHRGQRSNQLGNSAGPTPSVSVSVSTDPDQEAAARAYEDAVASAREATDVAGVSVGPVSAHDAAEFKDTGLIKGDISSIKNPIPGKTYSFTLTYVAGQSHNPATVLTTEVSAVASGSCAEPFLARPEHTYVIRCQATLLAGVTGKATLTLWSANGTMSGSVDLTDPAKYPTSPSTSTSSSPQSSAELAYSQAVAGASEASEVAGVSVGPVSARDAKAGGSVLRANGELPAVLTPGKRYQFSFGYTPSAQDVPVPVLSVVVQNVASWSCPDPVLGRPGHTYVIHCAVTALAGHTGKATMSALGPAGPSSATVQLKTR
jgi:hypothetical protein